MKIYPVANVLGSVPLLPGHIATNYISGQCKNTTSTRSPGRDAVVFDIFMTARRCLPLSHGRSSESFWPAGRQSARRLLLQIKIMRS
jgi:hypothetical protein